MYLPITYKVQIFLYHHLSCFILTSLGIKPAAHFAINVIFHIVLLKNFQNLQDRPCPTLPIRDSVQCGNVNYRLDVFPPPPTSQLLVVVKQNRLLLIVYFHSIPKQSKLTPTRLNGNNKNSYYSIPSTKTGTNKSFITRQSRILQT